jgi:NAD(P)H-hydrate epimerase
MFRLTRAQVREIDRRAIEDYHIPGIVLMENAARSAAAVAVQMLSPGSPVAIVCGGGNNGGDGLAIARHLHNAGFAISIHLVTDSPKYSHDTRINFEIVRAMRVPLGWDNSASLIIDALVGTGLTHPPRADALAAITQMIQSGKPILAIDVPSGLDCDTGLPLGEACIRATKTITFVAEKAGFANPESKKYTGEVIVGDIGCPRDLIERVAAG